VAELLSIPRRAKIPVLSKNDLKYANPAVKKFSKGKYSTWNQIKFIAGDKGAKLRAQVLQVVNSQRKIDADPNISRVKTKTHPYPYSFGETTYYYNKPKEFKRADYVTKRLKDPKFIKFAEKNFKPRDGLKFNDQGYKSATGETLKDIIRRYERTLINDDYIRLSDIGRILEKQGLYGPGTLSSYQSVARGRSPRGGSYLKKLMGPKQTKKIKTLFNEIDKILGKPTDLDSIYKLPEYGSLAGSRASVKGDFENARWKMPDEKKIGQLIAAVAKHHNVYGLNTETEKLVRELYNNETLTQALKNYKGGALNKDSELFKQIFLKKDPYARSYALMKLGKILHGEAELDGIKINKPLGKKIMQTMMYDASKKTYGPMYHAAYRYAQEELRPFINSNIQHGQLAAALKQKFKKYGLTKDYNIDEVFPMLAGKFNVSEFGKGANAYSMFSQIIDADVNQVSKRIWDQQTGQRTRKILQALKDKNFTAVNDLVSEHKESLKQFYKDNPAAKGKVALQDFNFNPETNTFATPREIFDAQFEGRYESLNPNLRKNIEKFYNKTGLSIDVGNTPTIEELRGVVDTGQIDISKGENITKDAFSFIQKTVKQNIIARANNNDNNICEVVFGIRGRANGGPVGGGCGKQMELEFDKAPEQTLNKVAQSTNPNLKGFAQRALSLFPKLGTVGKIGTVAAGAGIALSGLRYNPEKGEIVTTNNDQKADQNQILQYVKDNPLKVTAGSSLGFAAQEVPGAYKAARDLGRGRVRSTLGISGAIRPVLTTFGTPLLTGLYEGAIGAKRLEEGETMTDVLTDPVGPALGLTLMEPLSKLSGVVKDAPKRTMLEGAKNYFNLSNVGQARPGITGQILRMGMSPKMIAGASRFLGLPGLALGLGMSGYDAYKNYQNQEGMIYNLFNRDE
jgi:hypothetical protein